MQNETRENRRIFMTSGLKTLGGSAILLAGASGTSVLQAATQGKTMRPQAEGAKPYSVELGIPGIDPLTEWGVYAFLTNSTNTDWFSSNEGMLIGHLSKVPIDIPFVSIVGYDVKRTLDNLRDFALESPSKTVIAEFPKWHLCNKEIHEDAIRNKYRVLLFADAILNDHVVEFFVFGEGGRTLQVGSTIWDDKPRSVDISHITA